MLKFLSYQPFSGKWRHYIGRHNGLLMAGDPQVLKHNLEGHTILYQCQKIRKFCVWEGMVAIGFIDI